MMLEHVLHTEEILKVYLQYQLWVTLNLMGPAANAWRKDADYLLTLISRRWGPQYGTTLVCGLTRGY